MRQVSEPTAELAGHQLATYLPVQLMDNEDGKHFVTKMIKKMKATRKAAQIEGFKQERRKGEQGGQPMLLLATDNDRTAQKDLKSKSKQGEGTQRFMSVHGQCGLMETRRKQRVAWANQPNQKIGSSYSARDPFFYFYSRIIIAV